MVAFLSDEWVRALDRAEAADDDLRARCADLSLVIEQEVTDGPDGPVRFHVVLDHGTAAVRPGPAPHPTIRFSQDHETAADIARGRGSAQRAFMTGRLRVGGDLRVLLEHGEVLGQLGDVFAAVRAETDPRRVGDEG
ncbi:MAG: SCP2 sterol-binding domain-containing protein [Acidimicrobiales bacterium]